jgi:hypothetical protein
MRSGPQRLDLQADRVNRRTLLRAGLTTGLGVVALGATALTGAPSPAMETRAFLRQPGWAHCKDCQGLSFGEALWAGKCPKYCGIHQADGSLPYYLSYSDNINEPQTWDRQNQWRHCKRCQGLAYNGQGLLGWCPAGGHHDHTGSYNYFLWHDTSGPIYDTEDFAFCDKCMALFYRPAQASSWCGLSAHPFPRSHPASTTASSTTAGARTGAGDASRLPPGVGRSRRWSPRSRCRCCRSRPRSRRSAPRSRCAITAGGPHVEPMGAPGGSRRKSARLRGSAAPAIKDPATDVGRCTPARGPI